MAITYMPSYLEIEEPRLRFHSTETNYRSVNPIDGLNKWGPYDASISGFLRPNPLRLAIISPERSFPQLVRFLEKLGKEVTHNAADDYVETWPGFRQVFQTNLEFPTKADSPLVQIIPEQTAVKARQNKQPEVAFLDVLKNHIKLLLPQRLNFDVLLIHIPLRWKDFRERKTDNYYFDLHDALKVFSVPNNVAIQIVEEKSFNYPDQARVMWWIALALYVKGGGIPWKLAEPASDTAFVGLSYGILNKSYSKRVVTGCSQVFDENGEGLKFLLHPVETPIFHGRNPFMPKEDARRLFDKVREVYQHLNDKPPRRVVVHKTTYFSSDEMSGIATALSGIEEIELVQIQQDTLWRAIAFDAAKKTASNFPIRRGTVIPLDRYGFLLWTQGNVTGISSRGNYYQEKRGIPSPLIIRRFRGKSPIKQVASEVLRLTKMNWNNHQLYSRLPVTISFSNEIAQIAKQLDSVWPSFYDFRHFM